MSILFADGREIGEAAREICATCGHAHLFPASHMTGGPLNVRVSNKKMAPLSEAGLGAFEEVKHPRGRGGKFREVNFTIHLRHGDSKVTGQSLGNGLAVVHRVNQVSAMPEHQVYHVDSGMGVASVGDHGEDRGLVRDAMAIHFHGKDYSGKSVEELRGDKGLERKAKSVARVRGSFGHRVSEAEEHHKLKCPRCDRVQSASNKTCTNCGHDLSEARKAKFAKLNESVVEAVAVAFNPALHPRGRGGKFRDILGKLHELSPGHTRAFGGHIVTRGMGDEQHVYALQVRTTAHPVHLLPLHDLLHGKDLVHRGTAEEVADRLAPARAPKAPAAAKGSQRVTIHERPGGTVFKGTRQEPVQFNVGDRVILKDGREGTIRQQSFVSSGDEPTYHVHTTPPLLTPEMAAKHKAAFDAWNAGEAYLDNAGNYRLRGFNRSTGEVAPWNRAVKQDFPDNFAFHGAAKIAKGGWEARPESYTEQARHSDLSYAPEEMATRREAIEKRIAKGQAASGKPVDNLKAFQAMKFPSFPVGSGSRHGVPDEWMVENGYGEFVNPAMMGRNYGSSSSRRYHPDEGARVRIMPNAGEHGGKAGVLVAHGRGTTSGTDVVHFDGESAPSSVGSAHVMGEDDRAYVRLKPGVDMESMQYHYLVGHPPRTKYGPNTPGYEQWVYGLPKKVGGTGPIKAGDKQAILDRIARAVEAFEQGNRVGYLYHLAEACDAKAISEGAVAVVSLARGGARAAGRFDPAKHPRGRRGRWVEVADIVSRKGYYSLGHGISVEGGPLGFKVRDENNRVAAFTTARAAAKHAVSLHENQRRRVFGPAFLRRAPGGERVESAPALAPGEPIRLHSPSATRSAARALRVAGAPVEADHTRATGEIRHDNLTDVQLGRLADGLRGAGHHTSASFVHREIEKRAGRDAVRSPALLRAQRVAQERHQRLHGERVRRDELGVLMPGGGSRSKAQALVDSGFASDLADARAQLRDMGETAGRLTPGGHGEDLSIYHTEQLHMAAERLRREGRHADAQYVQRELNARYKEAMGGARPIGQRNVLRAPGGERSPQSDATIGGGGGGMDVASFLMGLGPGKHEYEIGGVPFTLYYDERGARGDSGSLVRGDKTGEWEVFRGHGDSLGPAIARVHVSPHGSSGYGNAGAPRYAAEEVARAIHKEVLRSERGPFGGSRLMPGGERSAGRDPEFRFTPSHVLPHLQVRLRDYGDSRSLARAESVGREIGVRAGEQMKRERAPQTPGGERKKRGSLYRLSIEDDSRTNQATEHVVEHTRPAKALALLVEKAGLELDSQDGRYGRLKDGRRVMALTEPWGRRKLDPFERKTRPGAPGGRGPIVGQ